MQIQANLDDVQNLTPVDTLIHLGAGRCSELDQYLSLHPGRLLLIEADAQLVHDLRERVAVEGLQHVQVSCHVIAAKPGSATFYRYNLPEVSSLHQASGLMDLFPGLKLLEKQQVETKSPVALLQPLELQAEKDNRLVIDLPGEELPVLQALQQARQLELFSQVHLYCGRQPLYKASEPATAVLAWLREKGFDLIAEDDSRDPDRPCWSFRRNALQLYNRDLKREVEQLVKIKKDQETIIADLKAQAEKLTQDRDAQSKLAREQESKINELAKQANESQTQFDQLTKAKDEQAKLLANLNIRLEKANKAKTEVEKLAADRHIELEAAIKALEEQAKLTAALKAQAENFTQDRDAQSKLAGEQESKINELAKQANDRKIQLDQLTKAKDEQVKLLTDLNGRLEQTNKARTEVEKLAADRHIELEAAIKARDEQRKLVADLKAQAEKLAQDRNSQSKLAGERETKINELTKQANEQKIQLEQLTKAKEEKQILEKQILQYQAEIEQRSKVEDNLQQELIDARQSVSLSIRLQTLREADLKDLQNRYHESQMIQESQHQLLVKLGERLSAASEYFHKLANNQPALLPQKKPQKGKKKSKKMKAEQVKPLELYEIK